MRGVWHISAAAAQICAYSRVMDAARATPIARTIWAYSCLDQKKLAENAGLNYNTIRYVFGEKNTRPFDVRDLYLLADAAGVPRRFVDLGFGPLKVVGEPLQSQLEAIEDRLSELERSLREVRPAEPGEGQPADLPGPDRAALLPPEAPPTTAGTRRRQKKPPAA